MPACSDRSGSSSQPVTVPLDAIRAAAEAHTDEMAQFLSEAITYASVESEGPPLLPATDALVERALEKGRELGFTTRRAAGGLVGILEYGSGDETVGALVHLDVVAPGDLDKTIRRSPARSPTARSSDAARRTTRARWSACCGGRRS